MAMKMKMSMINAKLNKEITKKMIDLNDTTIHGLEQLSEHDSTFQDMTKRKYVETNQDVISMVMSYDSKLTLCITHELDQNFMI